MSTQDLKPVMEPQSIAVIGASRQEGSVGYAVLQNLLVGNFRGVIYPVNPKARSICGIRAYPSVLEIPDEVDLAVVAVPAAIVPGVIEECGKKGVKGAIVISAGFKEVGVEGVRLERQVKEISKRYGMALVGPNCLGIINTSPSVKMDASFAREMPIEGDIAFVSQSGALCSAVLGYAKGQGIGFSKVVSMGNKAGVNENDFLNYLWNDRQTKVILLYLEDLADGRRFLELAREITGEGEKRKPIIAIKSGRTPEGARAVASHTGSLAGSDEVYEAVFAQCGVLRVETIKDLFDYAIVLANQPLPKGKRTCIITNAGGPGIMATDACVRYGLELAKLSEETAIKLGDKLSPRTCLINPIDLIGDARSDRYRVALEYAANDKNVDSILVLLTPQAMTDIRETAQVVAEVSKKCVKPVLACFMGDVYAAAGVKILRDNGVPCYSFPEEAVRALASDMKYLEWVQRPRTKIKTFKVKTDTARRLLLEAEPTEHGFIPEDAALQVLEAYGLPTIPWAAASSEKEAVEYAKKIGFPVALKILSSEIVHKFNVGGVVLNLRNEGEVSRGFRNMVENVKNKMPEAIIRGAIVQSMRKRGKEIILGVKKDAQFGQILMFGLGGIYVEVMRDVTFRLAPIRELSAYHMITSIRAHKLLEGVRGEMPSDIDAIAECIERLSQLAVEQEMIDELDINPLFVYEKGMGAVVADVRIAVRR